MPLVFTTPPLSQSAAHITSAVIASSYVFAVYVSQAGLPNNLPRDRNSPTVIRRRLTAATINTLLCCGLVLWIVWRVIPDNVGPAFELAFETTVARLGFPAFSYYPDIRHYLITPLLFLGPLYATFLSSTLPFQARWNTKAHLWDVMLSWQGFRTYCLAPLTEELTYRSCVISLMHLAGCKKTSMIFYSPLWFGAAHIHHALDTYSRTKSMSQAVSGSAFQFAYTTLFGWYASFLFLRTGSFVVPTVAHIFCNVMGLPMLPQELRVHPNRKISIIVSYILGLALFVKLLFPWTYAADSLYWSTGQF